MLNEILPFLEGKPRDICTSDRWKMNLSYVITTVSISSSKINLNVVRVIDYCLILSHLLYSSMYTQTFINPRGKIGIKNNTYFQNVLQYLIMRLCYFFGTRTFKE